MTTISKETLDAILPLGSSIIADAIEKLQIRLLNEGFIRSGVFSDLTPQLDPMIGYAVTAKVRTDFPPMKGAAFAENKSWWRYLQSVPGPKVVILLDCGETPGLGAFFGELHAVIHRVLGCVGIATNGAVRDLDSIRNAGLRCFAAKQSVSRAYAHITEFDIPVEIGGLRIEPGQLLYGDNNGILSIPPEHAEDIADIAAKIQSMKKRTIELCQSKDFSLNALEEMTESFGYAVANFSTELIERRKKL